MSSWTPLLERALRGAADAHLGQTRKASRVPYLTHPVAVAMILMQHGLSDEELLAAALLHDVVEDTTVSRSDLTRQFPVRVVELVGDLSEQKTDDAGQTRPWEDRKRDHLAHIASAPWEARAIALADKLHNLQTMLFDMDAGENLTDRFNAPLDRVLWYYETMSTAAAAEDAELESLAAATRAAVDELRRRLTSRASGTQASP